MKSQLVTKLVTRTNAPIARQPLLARNFERRASEENSISSLEHDDDVDDEFMPYMMPKEDETLANETEMVQQRWSEETLTENIRGGTQILVLWTVVMAIGRTWTYWKRPATDQCLHNKHSEMVSDTALFTYWIIELVMLGITTIPLYMCLKEEIMPSVRREFLYAPVVAFHFIYVIVVHIRPYSPGCEELFQLMQCADPPEFRRNQALHLDCSPQGHTCLFMCMTWIMLMPFIVPRRWMIHLIWFWIIFCYLGISVWRIRVRKSEAHAQHKRFREAHAKHGHVWRWNYIFRDTYFTDLDIIYGVVLLGIANTISMSKRFYLDKGQKHRFIFDLKLKGASQKMFEVLHYMVPTHTIGRMLKREVIADKIDRVSILFIMICDFDSFTSRLRPHELLAFLNEQFTAMDHVCQKHQVMKIETVGEEYVAAVGVMPSDETIDKESGHGEILGRLMKASAEILRKQKDEVRFKMGIHTGPVVAGVIGQKLPRFRLFGDTINTAARMMQKGMPGELQFGEETKRELPDWVQYRDRGHVEMKGKGQVRAYLLDLEQMHPSSPSSSVTLSDYSRHKKTVTMVAASDGDNGRYSSETSGMSGRSDEDSAPPRKRTVRKSIVDAMIANDFDFGGGRNSRLTGHMELDEASMQRKSLQRKSRLRTELDEASPQRKSRLRESLAFVSAKPQKSPEVPTVSEVELPEVTTPTNAASRPRGRTRVSMAPMIEESVSFGVDSCPVRSFGETEAVSRNTVRQRAVTNFAGSPRSPTRVISKESNTSSGAGSPASTTRDRKRAKTIIPDKLSEEALEECASALDSDPVLMEEFEKVLEEMRLTTSSQRRPTKCIDMFIDREGFTKEMEEQWFRWYHEEIIVYKLAARLDKHALALSLLTVIDTICMVANVDDPDEAYHVEFIIPFEDGGHLRFPMFLFARVIAFALLSLWRYAASSGSVWVTKNPRETQKLLLMTYLTITWLMYLSYDAKTPGCLKLDPQSKHTKEMILWEGHREKGAYSLLWLPIFVLITTSFQLRFNPSLAFVQMAMLLVLLDFLSGWRNFFIPSPHAKILFILNSVMNSYTAWLNENSSRARFRTKVLMDRTHNRIETILQTLLPPEVVAQVAQNKKYSAPPSHQYVRATIAQSDLVGFTQLSSTRTPEEVVRFMDELFGLFDELTEKYGIYKVETIGDAYIAGQAEYPLTDRNKPISVVLFGLDMVRKTHEWARGMGTNVTCRVGIHTGECIGGIVGTEMQRYHLFGNLMSVVEVLESTAPEGKVQTSQACREACERQRQDDGLPPEALIFEPIMSEQLQTSKGEVHDFSEIGGRSYTVRCYAQLRSLIKI